MNAFACFSLSPIGLAHPGIAVATSRAGGVGILDGEFCADWEQADQNLSQLLASVNNRDALGVRLCEDQLAARQTLLARLGGRKHWLILGAWQPQSIAQTLDSLPPSQQRQVLLEVTDAEQIAALNSAVPEVEGLVARGQESGGWVGEDSAFILTQKLLARQSRPVYVQGGVGIHTAAACRAAGAAGVILDDQLWLMPESPLPADWQHHLRSLSGQEAIVIGERLMAGCRLLSRPRFRAAGHLQQLANQIELETADAALARQRWQQQAQPWLGWGAPEARAWPIGQAVGLAAPLRERYQTTGRLVQAVLRQSLAHIETVQARQPLQADAPLAASHGTRYPIVQGPMTRVSDTAAFAQAVAQAGALPLLALALMRGDQVRDLLAQTQARLGNRPWGIGILGFVAQALREEQLQVIQDIKPPFALIAGGRPDQAARLEAQGIATYIHVPTPGLLQMFLEQGARRFVFEGRECGGHVGPLSSFVLWESMIEMLLAEVSPQAAGDVHILFAGGIHDARSAAMVSALAAPLVARGIRIGVLLGTAYLFTEEAVACGAIVPGFQAQALACRRTINLETGPGHASRCVLTPFAQEFYATRRRLAAAGSSPEAIKLALEDLNLGRLRLAAKGLERGADGQITAVSTERQQTDGMYMIGQVATLRSQVCSVQALHQAVSEASSQLLANLPGRAAIDPEPASACDIAIIGIGTLLPKAPCPAAFWQNILCKVDAIREIPPQRWDWQLYYDAERSRRDKVYSKWGGFLDEVPFDPLRYGIPPKSLKSIEPLQLLTLEVVRQALEDAGYGSGDFDRENTSVILGAGGGICDLGGQYATRAELPRFVEAPSDQVWQRLPEWTEETFPGLLLNVVAGRAANRFDFGGANFTVDAACASSLAALDLAVQELASGRSNLVIAGGVDTNQSPFTYFCFSKTQALSPRGRSRSFDQAADGIVISEGLAVVVLKRLADAERDGDRIYAVIKAVAGSSDGKALGMTAPLPAGQMRALRRAYRQAGFSPNTLSLYEAHGTGTVAGDRAELETVIETLKANRAEPRTCAIGSAKTLIGHTKSAAGIAGLVKVALALHHKVLPPHSGVDTPLAPIAEPESPVYLLQEARPWLAHPDQPRRGGVSAFGFGGTNFHAVLEEYRGEWRVTAPGAASWPWELLVFNAPTPETLAQEVQLLRQALQAGAEPRLADLAYSYALRAQGQPDLTVRLSIVAASLTQLQDALNSALAHLEGRASEPLPPHIQLGQANAEAAGRIAFLFPGQGAQYPDMLREVALYFPELRGALEFADRQLRERFPRLLSQWIYPPGAYSEAEAAHNRQQLTDTRVAQPAIGAVSAGLLDLAARLGLEPAMVGGHSYGEYTALHAAGVLSRADFLSLSETRGRVMAEACGTADGAMAAVQASRADLLKHLNGLENVVVANHNAPLQSVISGDRQAVTQLVERFSAAGILARLLPVAGAFHSRLVASARVPLTEALAQATLCSPRLPVYANATACPYNSEPAAIRQQLSEHLLSPVEFVGQIQAMYAAGARVFVELGPKSILTHLVGQILDGQAHTAVSLDGQGGGLRGLMSALGSLVTRGVPLQLSTLYAGREVQALDLTQLVKLTRQPELAPTTWLISGGSARPQTEAVGYCGKLAPLNQESAAQAAVAASQLVPHAQSTVTSQPTGPQPPVLDPAGPVANDAVLAAYQAYQATMRQFLTLQERVIQQFLGGAAVGQLPQSPPLPRVAVPSSPTQTPTPAPANLIPSQTNGQRPTSPTPQVLLPTAPLLQPSSFELNRASLTQLLLGLVSERTGYPAEMLGLDQDMEAELGIDSIKRVEILGALRQSLPEVLAASVQAQMESFSRVKTLNGVVEQLLQNLPTAEPAPATVAPPISALPDKASLTQLLLGLVSERTGYPAEMLGLDQDMEAELGIDSIKRVEILGALRQSLPEVLAASVQAQMESFSRVKTLNGVVEQLLQNLPTVAPEPVVGAAPEAQRLGEPWAGVETLPRYTLQAQTAPLLEPADSRLSGLFLITEDPLSVAPRLAAALKQMGAQVAILPSAVLVASELLAQRVDQLRQVQGPVAGIVHLAALAALPMPENLADWRTYTQSHCKSLFQLLNLCADDLQKLGPQGAGRVLAASLLGGDFGRQGEGSWDAGLPTGGSHSGLLKTLQAEWSEIQARAVDFDGSLSPEAMAQCLVEELLSAGEPTAVGYPQGKRTLFKPVATPLSETPQLVPTADWVVLVTGGARGITAAVASDLAACGLTLVVTGRSAEPTAESPETEGIEDIASLRQVFLRQARTQSLSPTPVQISGQLQGLLRNRAIRRNLRQFRQLGAKVEYQPVDVRNEPEFGALIEAIYARYGRLDAVIHGAGIIEDKLLADKTLASFDRVFDTKVDSAFLLSRYLRPESLKLLVLFGSVAGSFGNRGQCDYAAANELVNRLAWQLDRSWSHSRVVVLNWGPWDVTGMASEAVNEQFKARGVIPIPPRAGRQFFMNEVRYGQKGETELIVGTFTGLPWATQGSQTTSPGSFILVPSPSPPRLQADGTLTLEHTFSRASDPYLLDHCLDGKPVLPAAAAVEWLAQLVQAAWSDWTVTEVSDLRVLRGLVLEPQAVQSVRLSARASSHADAQSLSVAAEIVDADSQIAFYRATVILRPQLPEAPVLSLQPLSASSSLDAVVAYRDYLFHGKCFQLISAIDCLNEQGIDAQVKPSQPSAWLPQVPATARPWLFDPGLLDTAPQLAIIWARLQHGTTALPSRFGSVIRFGVTPPKAPIQVVFRVQQMDGNTLKYDATFVDASGEVCLQLKDVESTCSTALNRLASQ